MIIKKEALINEIVYDNMVYNNGKYVIFLTIRSLKRLIKEMIESKATTKFIRFNPFYVNERKNSQIEFDEYMFYMECRDNINQQDYEKHIELNNDKKVLDMSDEEVRINKILLPLCDYKDIESYKKYLEAYSEFLNELIPKLMENAKIRMQLTHEDLGFGYFCFEVHSH